MSATNHYHDRIHRATERLAQLQARELLASQRQAVRAKEIQRREESKRRMRVAELVFLTGAETLEDSELIAALRNHMINRAMISTNHAGESLTIP
jgi:hypothetical protein